MGLQVGVNDLEISSIKMRPAYLGHVEMITLQANYDMNAVENGYIRCTST